MNTFETPNDTAVDDGSLLLETLWQRSGLRYLSDLKLPDGWLVLRAVLLSTAPEQYPVDEWNKAARFLTCDGALMFSRPQDAWNYLYALCTVQRTNG